MVTEAEPEQSPFNVVVHDQGITVWVTSGDDAEVFDKNGGLVPWVQAVDRPCDRVAWWACAQVG
ncbi:hypothetical protein ACFWP5_20805 [Streptomyces sp. NPDC058469]|uniref:hypothetical protein n=1 Tax=Streptomyces sp. NPDC058469 TaxID=3346514 RepID=UPI00364D5CD6